MNGWRFVVRSLVPTGNIGHRLLIMKADDPMENRWSAVTNMEMRSFEPNSFIPDGISTLDDS